MKSVRVRDVQSLTSLLDFKKETSCVIKKGLTSLLVQIKRKTSHHMSNYELHHQLCENKENTTG